jgi:hypothetical protein
MGELALPRRPGFLHEGLRRARLGARRDKGAIKIKVALEADPCQHAIAAVESEPQRGLNGQSARRADSFRVGTRASDAPNPPRSPYPPGKSWSPPRPAAAGPRS